MEKKRVAIGGILPCAAVRPALDEVLDGLRISNEPNNGTTEPCTRVLAAKVLEQEAKYSYVGVTGDLHYLGELASIVVPFDNSVPLIVPPNGEYGRIDYELAMTRLNTLHSLFLPVGGPNIQKMLGLGESLVIAGGAVSRAIWVDIDHFYSNNDDGWMSYRDDLPDIDLFLVGLGEEDAKRQINLLGNVLKSIYGKVLVFRSERCITFKLPDGAQHGRSSPNGYVVTRTIQVVLRLYNTISEVVHGFDLGSSAVAFYRGEVVMSSKWRFAFERGLNILDLSRRRASYEHRIRKYFDRGFGIVLPDLNIDKVLANFTVRDLDRFDLPRLRIKKTYSTNSGIEGNIIRDSIEAIFPRNFSIDGVEKKGFYLPRDEQKSVKQVAPLGALHGFEKASKTGTEDPDNKAVAAVKSSELTEVSKLLEGPLGRYIPLLAIIYGYAFEEELAFDEDRFMSEYDLGWNHQFRVGEIACGNLWHAQQPVVKSASLCLMTSIGVDRMEKWRDVNNSILDTSEGKDLCTSGEPFVGLDSVLKILCAADNPHVSQLVRLLGKDRAARVVTEIIAGTFAGAEQLAQELVSEFAARAAVEFRFMRVEESTCLAGGGPLRMAVMTPEEWYGDYFKVVRPAEP